MIYYLELKKLIRNRNGIKNLLKEKIKLLHKRIQKSSNSLQLQPQKSQKNNLHMMDAMYVQFHNMCMEVTY